MSIRLADDLKHDLEAAALKLKMDTHQVMRLAMEVGLEHFTRIDHDLAACVVERIARDAQSKASLIEKPPVDLVKDDACAVNANSNAGSRSSSPILPTRAKIVPLQPPPTRTTPASPHSLNEEATPYVVEQKKRQS